MYRDEQYIRDKLKSFYESMIEFAKADGVISDEEIKILVEIEDGINNLKDQLLNVLKSELSEKEFLDLQNQILQDIIINTTEVAKQNNVITEGEYALIEKLREYAERGGVMNDG